MLKKKFRFRGSYFCYAMTYFFYYVGMGVFVSIMSMYLLAMGKSTTEMTFIVSASSLFGIFMIPLVGFFMDRVKRPRLLTAALLIGIAVFGAVFALSQSTWALYVLDGLIMGLISSLSPVTERMASSGRYRYGMVRCWGTIGYAIASQVSAIIIDVADPRMIFIFFCASAVLASVGFLCADGISFQKEAAAEEEKPSNSFAFLKQPMYWLFILMALIFSGVGNLNNTFSAILLQDLGVSTSLVGTAIFLSTLVELPIVLFSNKFMDRFSGKTLSAASFIILIVQFIIYSVSTTAAPAFAALVLLRAVGATLFMMVQLKVIRGIVDENSVSTAQGLMNSTNSVVVIFAQNAGGLLVEATSIRFMYIILTALMAVALVLCIFLKVNNTKKVFS